ncbi:MAG TPA: hypothetical protein VMQ61_13855 [Thermoanaerobaculia bacterium]|nr:hypothetical protein [Thermoanaerobaculia bacterium]
MWSGEPHPSARGGALVLRTFILTLTFVAVLVVAYRSRVDWRSHDRGARELSGSASGPVRFPLPEDRTRAPRDMAESAAPILLPPPPAIRLEDDGGASPVVLAGHTPGHRLRGPPPLPS